MYLAADLIEDAKYTILLSHPNADDLGFNAYFMYKISQMFGVNMLCYDYSGYGISSGQPSEENMYADIDAAYQALQSRYGVPPNRIILFGQSIGSAPTIDLASR